jgi:hypothetical protein
MAELDDVKVTLRQAIAGVSALVIAGVAGYGAYYNVMNNVHNVSLKFDGLAAQFAELPKDIRREIRIGDVKGEMQTLKMELSYMENHERDESEERLYQTKTRTLARLEEEWAGFQK